ncbi:MAG TPA: hypothetical protein VJ521_07020 [Acidobacteriota bacterium]|nr:hypothetical protein [Acidobacteriota bacterium]
MRTYQTMRHCDDCGFQLRQTQHGWFEEFPYKVHMNIDHDHVIYAPGSTINLSNSQSAAMNQVQIEAIPWSRPTTAKHLSAAAARDQSRTVETDPEYPGRAAWLKGQMRLRSWNKHDVERHGGPNNKTVQRILNGVDVRVDVLEKLAAALCKNGDKIESTDIPEN